MLRSYFSTAVFRISLFDTLSSRWPESSVARKVDSFLVCTTSSLNNNFRSEVATFGARASGARDESSATQFPFRIKTNLTLIRLLVMSTHQ